MSHDLKSMSVEIHSLERVFNGFFKLDEITTTHETYRGDPIKKTWLVFERGDAIAIVLYKSDSKEVVLVRQFRAPTLKFSRSGEGFTPLNDGQLDETIAGMPRGGETHAECAIREVREEAGYIVRDPELIGQFYASPGGTSERNFLYFAEVTDDDRAPEADQKVGGATEESEDTLVRHVPVSAFFTDVMRVGDTVDSKILIASMLLRARLRDIPTPAQQPAESGESRYALEGVEGVEIGLKTGDMLHVRDVDAWVNSENSDMEMDRFIGKSISAMIRYHGAAKDEKGRVLEDTIAAALKRSMRGRNYSRIGTVHDTTSGALWRSNNVRRIFHVAAVEGVIGKGVRANENNIERIILNSLKAIEKRSRSKLLESGYASALLPMVGAGDGGLSAEVTFPLILDAVLGFYANADGATALKKIFVSAYSRHDVEVAEQALSQCPKLKRLN